MHISPAIFRSLSSFNLSLQSSLLSLPRIFTQSFPNEHLCIDCCLTWSMFIPHPHLPAAWFYFVFNRPKVDSIQFVIHVIFLLLAHAKPSLLISFLFICLNIINAHESTINMETRTLTITCIYLDGLVPFCSLPAPRQVNHYF